MEEYQNMANKSTSKEEDWFIANLSFIILFRTGVDGAKDVHNWSQLLTDSDAMMPMPESVGKQYINALIDFKYIDLLHDLPIDIGVDRVLRLNHTFHDSVKDFENDKDAFIKWSHEKFFS